MLNQQHDPIGVTLPRPWMRSKTEAGTRGPQRAAPFPIDVELRDSFLYLSPRAQAPLFW